MKNGVGILAGLMIITIAGGVLTSGVGFNVPIVEQTADPSGSFFHAPPGQALVLLLWVLIVLGGLLANGAIAAGLIWFFNREVKIAGLPPASAEQASSGADALPENAG